MCHFRNQIPVSLLGIVSCMLANAGAVVRADEPLFDAPWRAFDVADYPAFAPIASDYGDVDGDGDIDVVSAREFWWSPGIAVLRNNGDGTFATEELYDLPSQMDCGYIVLHDMDLDGDLDAVTTIPGNAGTDFRMALWRNLGDGTYDTAELYSAGLGPTGLVIADFTGDGFPDVMTADNGYVAGTNDTISLIAHNGQAGAQAGFLAPVSFHVGDNCMRLSAADVDGDGDLDLAVGRAALAGGVSGVEIVMNDGSGQFSVSQRVEAVPGAYRNGYAVVLDDIDNDGDPDLIAGGATNDYYSYCIVSIRRNNGSGTFGQPEFYTLTQGTFTPWDIRTCDVNGDGWRDILVSTPSGRTMDGWNYLPNLGDGTFAQSFFYSAAKWTYEIDAFDVDGDGDEDVVTTANDSSAITVHTNPGDGDFFVPVLNFVGSLERDMVQGDIDQDGDVDLVTGGNSDVHLLFNNGDATFPSAVPYDTPFAPGDILLADMNNDGCLDLVVRSYDFAVALNDCETGFQPAVVTQVGSSQAGEIAVFDLDNDGDLDVVCTDPGPQSRVFLFRNNGNGISFTLANVIADFDGLPFGIAGGDLDHDATIDLIFQNALGISVYLGNGDFTVSGPFPTSDYGYPFILEDLNNDGNLDLAYKRPEPSFGVTEVATMLGYGDGSFSFPEVYSGPNGRESAFRVTSDVDVADLNSDGLPDVLFTNNAPNDISVFAGAGTGELLPQDRYGAGYSASDSAVADFNGDGINDVASVISLPPYGLGDAVVILLGRVPDSNGGRAELIDLTMIKGTILAGTVDELRASDDSYVLTRSGFGQSLVDLHHMEMQVTAVTTVADPSSVDVLVEARISHLTGQAQIRLKNWNTTAFDLVGSYVIGETESTQTFPGLDASKYVGTSGEIEMRIKHVVFVPFVAFDFDSFIDEVRMNVR